jgi:hypothetical protein
MKKTIGVIAAVATLLAIFGGGAVVRAAQRGTTCTLNGTAKFTPALTASPVDTKYKFTGKLTDCQSTGGVETATVKSSGAGSLGCSTGSSTGKAVITWNDGKTTKVAFETNDAAALAQLDGEVTGGTSKAFSKGDQVFGALVFNADAAKCTGDGLDSAEFQGQVGGGSPN